MEINSSNYRETPRSKFTAREAFDRFIQYPLGHVLDVGSGEGNHAKILRELGNPVTTVDLGPNSDIREDYLQVSFDEPFDSIWCAHTLEHQPNPNLFLKKINNDLKEEGVLAITVPPRKDKIVGGHVTLWNPGLLLYQLILAGFDCSNARVGTYGYNISVVTKKKQIRNLPNLKYDKGDIEILSRYFPFNAKHGFDGILKNIGW